MILISNYRIGRICLHLAAMVADHKIKWHLAGIGPPVKARPIR
jgi:hypothetical protein